MLRKLQRKLKTNLRLEDQKKRLQMSEIDPREFGKLEAQVEALQAEVHALRQDI